MGDQTDDMVGDGVQWANTDEAMSSPMRKIEQHPCGREGCTSNATNHYHCGRCTSTEVTSMMGHYRRDADGRERYTCKVEDLPEPDRDIRVRMEELQHENARLIAELVKLRTPMAPQTLGLEDTRALLVAQMQITQSLHEQRRATQRKVVSTVEELDALPVHTVIVGVGDKFENEHSDMAPTVFQRQDLERKSAWWRSPDYVEFMTSIQLAQLKFLPALYVVVWSPAEEGR